MAKNAIFYKPNIIGYTRLLILMISIGLNNELFLVLYSLSVSLDYFDGLVARAFSEESHLGACLDMITDRVSTTILCIKILILKDIYVIPCCMYIFFDILGHFLYFVAMVHKNVHHKAFKQQLLFRIYYNNIFLKLMCVGSELFFIYAYYSRDEYSLAEKVFAFLPIVKTFFHIVHMLTGIRLLSRLEV